MWAPHDQLRAVNRSSDVQEGGFLVTQDGLEDDSYAHSQRTACGVNPSSCVDNLRPWLKDFSMKYLVLCDANGNLVLDCRDLLTVDDGVHCFKDRWYYIELFIRKRFYNKGHAVFPSDASVIQGWKDFVVNYTRDPRDYLRCLHERHLTFLKHGKSVKRWREGAMAFIHRIGLEQGFHCVTPPKLKCPQCQGLTRLERNDPRLPSTVWKLITRLENGEVPRLSVPVEESDCGDMNELVRSLDEASSSIEAETLCNNLPP